MQAFAAEKPALIDTASMQGKTLCGYQGWFRCQGDGANLGWIHWSKAPDRIDASTLSFEMWPDMSEYKKKYKAGNFTYPHGREATLFSAYDYSTVLTHFKWMQEYGIDGVWLQRFVVDLAGGPKEERFPSRQKVLHNVMDSAEQTGRVWALAYDMAGMPTDKLYEVMVADWKKLVDQKIIDHPRYLHHNGKPVLCIWGFYTGAGNVNAEVANRIIDFFKNDPNYGVFLVGGGDWGWHRQSGEKLSGYPLISKQWYDFYRRFDCICPWNVGNSVFAEGKRWANTQYWESGKKEAKEAGMLYLPVVYPGFGWDNLKRCQPGTTTFPRQGGEFYWRQWYEAAKLGCDMVYVAMFDEADEGTAIFKVTNQPPTQAFFLHYEDKPTDWYLRLTGEGARMLRGEIPLSQKIPIKP